MSDKTKTKKTNHRSLDELATAIDAMERRRIIEIGTMLLEAKAGHPKEFMKWVESRDWFSVATAERMMKVALLAQRFVKLTNLK
jgi:hypothetical protein